MAARIVVIALACWLIAIEGAPDDGSEVDNSADALARECASDADRRSCVAFISGVIQGVQVSRAALDTKKLFCAPEGVTIGQTVKVFQKWIADRPEELHISKAVAVVQALQDAFPCPEIKSKR